MNRREKIIRAETKIIDHSHGRVRAVVSTEARDRDGDIIRASGWDLDNFLQHPVLIASHNYHELRAQIGTWEDMQVKGKQLEGIARYYVGEGNEEADWGFNLAGKGQAAFSVGFIPDMSKSKELANGPGLMPSYEFNKQELLEVSHVTIPANPQALLAVKSIATHPVITELIDDMLADQVATESLIQGGEFIAPAEWQTAMDKLHAEFSAAIAEVEANLERFTAPASAITREHDRRVMVDSFVRGFLKRLGRR